MDKFEIIKIQILKEEYYNYIAKNEITFIKSIKSSIYQISINFNIIGSINSQMMNSNINLLIYVDEQYFIK